jgi:hypothetical protein
VDTNHYDMECPFSKYEDRLASMASSYNLPGSMVSNSRSVIDPTEFRRECSSFANAQEPAPDTDPNNVINAIKPVRNTPSVNKGPYFQQIYKDDEMPVRMTNISATDFKEATIPLNLQKSFFFNEIKMFRKAAITARLNEFEIVGFYHVSRQEHYWREVIEEQLLLIDSNFQSQLKNLNKNSNKKKQAIQSINTLLKETSKLFINVIGQTKDDRDAVERAVKNLKLQSVKSLTKKIIISYNETVGLGEFFDSPPAKRAKLTAQAEISEGEYSTITKMYEYCRNVVSQEKKAFVYFFSTHGACCARKGPQWSPDVIHNPVASWREALNTFILEYPSICLRALLNGYPTCGIDYADARFT